jgi:methylmalonyl-CoA mutase
VPALKQALKKQGGDHIVLICGGVIPVQDYDYLLKNGASMVFGPGTKVTDAAVKIVELIENKK